MPRLQACFSCYLPEVFQESLVQTTTMMIWKKVLHRHQRFVSKDDQLQGSTPKNRVLFRGSVQILRFRTLFFLDFQTRRLRIRCKLPVFDIFHQSCDYDDMGVSKNRGTPKSSILIGVSIINHPFWGTSTFGNTHMFIFKGALCFLFFLRKFLLHLFSHAW